MKTKVKNTILLFFASLLFLFGNSVNIIHFCCDLCRSQGFEVVEDMHCHDESDIACCENIESENNNHSLHCNGNCPLDQAVSKEKHDHKCRIDRVTIELDDYVSKSNIKIFSNTLLFSHIIADDLSIYTNPQNNFRDLPYQPLKTGKSLLKSNCILRI